MINRLAVNGVDKLYLNESKNDLWIREIVFPNLRNGYFVEAGAADGISGSSCFLLEKALGWRGLCIEPHDGFFPRLVRNRPNSIHANVCLADQDGWVDFASGEGSNGVTSYLSGVRTAIAANETRGEWVLANSKIVRKPAARLIDLLRKHDAPPLIEYGAFDIEGSEFEALRSFPFDEHRFLAFSFEMNRSFMAQLTELLTGKGYVESVNPFNTDCPWESYWLHETMARARLLP